MNTSSPLSVKALFLSVAIPFLVPGCSSDESGSSEPPPEIQFNVSQASLLATYSDSVQLSQLVTTGVDSDELISESNLLASDEQGTDTWAALQAEYPFEVMYTAADAGNEYLYVALEGMQDDTHAPLIAEYNCAFYRVTVADDSYGCVAEGLHLQDIDKWYPQMGGPGQKPIQFDGSGNIYFLAHEFTSYCAENDDPEAIPVCYLSHPSSGFNVYKLDITTSEVTALNTQLENIHSFIVLASGDVVLDMTDASQINRLRWISAIDGSAVDVNGGFDSEFFSADSIGTLLWSRAAISEGVRLVRVKAGGVVEQAEMKLDPFINTTPSAEYLDRLIFSRDGRLYGYFSLVTGANQLTIKVQQVFPYSSTVFWQKDVINDSDYIAWMDDGPFRIVSDTLYELRTTVDPSYGIMDTIHMYRLSDQSEISPAIFTDDAAVISLGANYYDIYQWRVVGSKIYFAALEKSNETYVNGVIDSLAVRDGLSQNDYLTLHNMASLQDALNVVEDIEVLRPKMPPDDNQQIPVVTATHVDTSHVYSIGVEFSEAMNTASVEAALSFMESGATPVPYVPLWLGNSLHIVPDRDGDLSDFNTMPLGYSTNYELSIAGTAEDLSGTAMNPFSYPFTTDAAPSP